MARRFVSIWFCQLLSNWQVRRQPDLQEQPFVLAAPDHGRMRIVAVSNKAKEQGIRSGMVLADARTLLPGLLFFDHVPGRAEKILEALGHWCIRYSPAVAIDLPDGLILDASGCAHLWGGEEGYLKDLSTRLQSFGYETRLAMADSIGTAWAMARFGQSGTPVPPGQSAAAMAKLPAAALRIPEALTDKLLKLGLRQVGLFMGMQRSVLRRRFGKELLLRLDQALGLAPEMPQWLQPIEPYQERLPCLDAIRTAVGIELAIQKLLTALCDRLRKEGKGLRQAHLHTYRLDHQQQKVSIGTHRPTHNPKHLFRLFEMKIEEIAPGPGIELFVLEATHTEECLAGQDSFWKKEDVLNDNELLELIDRMTNKLGGDIVHRYLPEPRYWPERSIRCSSNLKEQPAHPWPADRWRPIQLLARPERITVSAPIPDYPPMLFRYRGQLYPIKKADGPERIEREWWLEAGEHRDYYIVEDEKGCRYWIFRLGHYGRERPPQWFVHGFFP